MILIGLTGKKRSGKDTFAACTKNAYHNVHTTSFAAPIRKFICDICGFKTLDELEANKNTVHPTFKKTPREMMQTLGTEWGREMVHPDLWETLVSEELKTLSNTLTTNDIVLVTDVRFDNEAKLIHLFEGINVEILRPNMQESDQHISEQGVSPELIDITLKNDYTVEALGAKADELINALQKYL